MVEAREWSDVEHVSDESAGTRREVLREGFTMAFYVAICLLAALAALGGAALDHRADVLRVVWGTTLGLAVAHVFAFRLSARLVGKGTPGAHDPYLIASQLIGASAVAVAVTLPVLVVDTSAELDVARFVLVGVIGGSGYRTARAAGGSRARSATYAAAVVALALVVTVIKNVVSGH